MVWKDYMSVNTYKWIHNRGKRPKQPIFYPHSIQNIRFNQKTVSLSLIPNCVHPRIACTGVKLMLHLCTIACFALSMLQLLPPSMQNKLPEPEFRGLERREVSKLRLTMYGAASEGHCGE